MNLHKRLCWTCCLAHVHAHANDQTAHLRCTDMCKLQTCSNKANDLEEEDLVMNDDVDDCD